MDLFGIVASVVTLAAFFSYLNHRFFHMPSAIGVMSIALVLSLVLIGLHRLGLTLDDRAAALLAGIDFNRLVLQGMLGFLLFAGALHVDLNDLREEKWAISLLATVGVVTSTVLVGLLMWGTLSLLGLGIPLIYCFLFGALISPTDPIAVLGILKSAGVPKRLQTKITGESLFNDGIGVVVFLVLLDVATGAHDVSGGAVVLLLLQETLGGAALGFAAGTMAYLLLRSVDNYQVEVLGTLSLVMGTYALAGGLHLSGPIAVVVAGLLVGNHGRRFAMSQHTRQRLDTFWELIDEILNAVLFVLIGLEVLILPLTPQRLVAGAVAIGVVLFARLLSVGAPIRLLGIWRDFGPHTVRVLTWAGLRGGISVALALALPRGDERDVLVVVTYSVVLFSIIVQGLSIGAVIRRAGLSGERVHIVPPAAPAAARSAPREEEPGDDVWTI